MVQMGRLVLRKAAGRRAEAVIIIQVSNFMAGLKLGKFVPVIHVRLISSATNSGCSN